MNINLPDEFYIKNSVMRGSLPYLIYLGSGRHTKILLRRCSLIYYQENINQCSLKEYQKRVVGVQIFPYSGFKKIFFLN